MDDWESIPVFKGRRVIVFRSTNSGVLDFGGSKILPQEFHLRYPVPAGASLERVEDDLRGLEHKVLSRFPDDEFLYLTTRRDFWERIRGRDGGGVVYQATVSATYVKMVKAHDEFTTTVVSGK